MQETVISAKNLHLKPEKSKYGPTSAEMKEFADKFTKGQWDKLCSIKGFCETVSSNIEEANKIAKEAKM